MDPFRITLRQTAYLHGRPCVFVKEVALQAVPSIGTTVATKDSDVFIVTDVIHYPDKIVVDTRSLDFEHRSREYNSWLTQIKSSGWTEAGLDQL